MIDENLGEPQQKRISLLLIVLLWLICGGLCLRYFGSWWFTIIVLIIAQACGVACVEMARKIKANVNEAFFIGFMLGLVGWIIYGIYYLTYRKKSVSELAKKIDEPDIKEEHLKTEKYIIKSKKRNKKIVKNLFPLSFVFICSGFLSVFFAILSTLIISGVGIFHIYIDFAFMTLGSILIITGLILLEIITIFMVVIT